MITVANLHIGAAVVPLSEVTESSVLSAFEENMFITLEDPISDDEEEVTTYADLLRSLVSGDNHEVYDFFGTVMWIEVLNP